MNSSSLRVLWIGFIFSFIQLEVIESIRGSFVISSYSLISEPLQQTNELSSVDDGKESSNGKHEGKNDSQENKKDIGEEGSFESTAEAASESSHTNPEVSGQDSASFSISEEVVKPQPLPETLKEKIKARALEFDQEESVLESNLDSSDSIPRDSIKLLRVLARNIPAIKRFVLEIYSFH